ncbi:biotin/lipoyl-containing protein [Mucilaginibacter xinganensis]|uniref:Acetyl-CoA carboxylase biotin carboxyl carrier protein subunit n=1 Tax=Mucilaginibacter xinganensis TaxID=1234841 RepID=A0A223P1Q2_9SPHI|nr:acetyl-CoA carboxylase biotin carboxyl carrier protein subunit [Mucilaginibacter xinganensis]ASU36079.1 acetyl-CoA carboxylase biotin carboxyl carrier protein subunit [Mucilaginibacter xinganensis]
MLKVKANRKYNYDIEKKGDEVFINGGKIVADIRQLNPLSFHVINELKSYNVEVVSFSEAEKTAEIKVNNNTYILASKDQFDILLDQLGLSNLNAAQISEVKAPMPGMVLKVFVNEGTEIKKGDNLFVLEAMKMENIIKAGADAVVKTVKIKPGDKVEKGQVLLLF